MAQVTEPLQPFQALGCRHCRHLEYPSDGDFGEINWMECALHAGRANLPTFPFESPQRCFTSGVLRTPCENLKHVAEKYPVTDAVEIVLSLYPDE